MDNAAKQKVQLLSAGELAEGRTRASRAPCNALAFPLASKTDISEVEVKQHPHSATFVQFAHSSSLERGARLRIEKGRRVVIERGETVPPTPEAGNQFRYKRGSKTTH